MKGRPHPTPPSGVGSRPRWLLLPLQQALTPTSLTCCCIILEQAKAEISAQAKAVAHHGAWSEVVLHVGGLLRKGLLYGGVLHGAVPHEKGCLLHTRGCCLRGGLHMGGCCMTGCYMWGGCCLR